MKTLTLRNGLLGLGLVTLVAAVVLLGSSLLPLPGRHVGAGITGPAPAMTADCDMNKPRASVVRAPRLQHDPLKALLRGILI